MEIPYMALWMLCGSQWSEQNSEINNLHLTRRIYNIQEWVYFNTKSI